MFSLAIVKDFYVFKDGLTCCLSCFVAIMINEFFFQRTPNDNPFIESAFSTVKGTPEYPGVFLDKTVAIEYFKHYFQSYNEEHYHFGIDYVTPAQAHQGLHDKIVSERKQKLNEQRQWRKAVNRGLIEDPYFLQHLSKTSNQSELCSVIHL